jgi:GDP-4-dehydro-6-deoxy-D-mannose reductase
MSIRKNILITGIHGFSGRFLADYVIRQYPDMCIWGIGRSSKPVPAGVRFVHCDLNDLHALNSLVEDIQPQYVCHLAGINHNDNPAELFRGNVIATINLLEAIRPLAHQVHPRVLVIGSAAIYGSVPEDKLPIKESLPLNPDGFYGLSKFCQDRLSQEYHKKHGLDIIRARTFNIIGPGQPTSFVCGRIVDKLCEAVEGSSEIIRFGGIKVERDFVDIRDVVAAYVALLEHGKCGEAYNIGSGRSVEITSVIDWVKNYLNISPRIEIESGMHGNSVCTKSVANIDKITAAAPWAPLRSLQESLKDMVDARLRVKDSSQGVK